MIATTAPAAFLDWSLLQVVPDVASPASRPSARALRGASIAATSGAVTRRGEGVYGVRSSDGSREYLVQLLVRAGCATCDCEDYRRRCARPTSVCKHGLGVLAWEASRPSPDPERVLTLVKTAASGGAEAA